MALGLSEVAREEASSMGLVEEVNVTIVRSLNSRRKEAVNTISGPEEKDETMSAEGQSGEDFDRMQKARTKMILLDTSRLANTIIPEY